MDERTVGGGRKWGFFDLRYFFSRLFLPICLSSSSSSLKWPHPLYNLLRLMRDGGKLGDGYLCPTTYSLHCQHQNDCIMAGSCVRHFDVSLIVRAKSQDSVHKPQFLKRKESRSGSNRGPSADQHSALPLGHTVSQTYTSDPHKRPRLKYQLGNKLTLS